MLGPVGTLSDLPSEHSRIRVRQTEHSAPRAADASLIGVHRKCKWVERRTFKKLL
jgi:hypothetical protein